ncbi:hypothetical protein AKJ09_06653 [Labilithrix luteola]|uniref:Uncharacterized protein n=1 Tax=Labilithrix luteola TaxID=1391654 RepID=A0A0K1Q3M8_9BACT|nr:hypothetical protein AKJ09_06653 [Labilithrix luteola]
MADTTPAKGKSFFIPTLPGARTCTIVPSTTARPRPALNDNRHAATSPVADVT